MDKNIGKSSVAVLLPVYNAEKYLKEAIDSILNQTYKNFDFYIINDGSSDKSEEIIESYNDDRIKYIKNEENKGLIYTLNKGLELIKADYILRMDSDDISMPERIEKEVVFMDANPDVIVCGTQIEYFGEKTGESKFPLSHNEIHARLLFLSSLAHPSVIFRRSELEKNNLFYKAGNIHLEDYELWTRAAKHGKLANLNEVLLRYRISDQNITINNWNTREDRLKEFFKKILVELNIEPSNENLNLHLELGFNRSNLKSIKALREHADTLIKKNELYEIYPMQEFKEVISIYWKKMFFLEVEKGFSELLKYWYYSKSISFVQLRYALLFYFNRKKNKQI